VQPACGSIRARPASTRATPTAAPGARDSLAASLALPGQAFAASFALYLLTEAPAMAVELSPSNPFEGPTANSLYVTLGLFLMSVPGAPTRRQPRRQRPAVRAGTPATQPMSMRPAQLPALPAAGAPALGTRRVCPSS